MYRTVQIFLLKFNMNRNVFSNYRAENFILKKRKRKIDSSQDLVCFNTSSLQLQRGTSYISKIPNKSNAEKSSVREKSTFIREWRWYIWPDFIEDSISGKS